MNRTVLTLMMMKMVDKNGDYVFIGTFQGSGDEGQKLPSTQTYLYENKQFHALNPSTRARLVPRGEGHLPDQGRKIRVLQGEEVEDSA